MNASETKILKVMAEFAPTASESDKRSWAMERIEREEQYAAGLRELRAWQGTEAGMQEMFS